MKHYTRIEGPVGPLLAVADDEGLTGLYFEDDAHTPEIGANWEAAPLHPLFHRLQHELSDYFAGRRVSFGVPLIPEGSVFQHLVWKAITRIAYGSALTLAEVADEIGHPHAVQAIGRAVRLNPLAVVVPCHRVIGAKGAIAESLEGRMRRRALLNFERRGAARISRPLAFLACAH